MRTGTVIGLGVLAAFAGMLAVTSISSAASSNMLVGETWRVTYSVNPPVDSSQATLDQFEVTMRQAQIPGFEVVDVQYTPTSAVMTVRPTAPISKPPIRQSMSFGGHTLTLVSAERV